MHQFNRIVLVAAGCLIGLVVLNRLSGNQPADIVTDAASTPNTFVGNRCDTSIPDGLCGP